MPQLRLPRDGVQPTQLHRELLAAIPRWGPVRRPDGQWHDPGLLNVESTETEVRLTFPEASDEPEIRAVLAAHLPRELPVERQRREAAKRPGSLSLPERVTRLEIVLGLE